jgi:hypothetical protein
MWAAPSMHDDEDPIVDPTTFHILDVTLQGHRPFGEPMTGSLGKKHN